MTCLEVMIEFAKFVFPIALGVPSYIAQSPPAERPGNLAVAFIAPMVQLWLTIAAAVAEFLRVERVQGWIVILGLPFIGLCVTYGFYRLFPYLLEVNFSFIVKWRRK